MSIQNQTVIAEPFKNNYHSTPKEFDLPEDERKLYQKLMRKFRAENVTKEEHKQLTDFNDKLEGLNVERLKCLIEIAKIRQKDLQEVMKELSIKPKNYE